MTFLGLFVASSIAFGGDEKGQSPAAPKKAQAAAAPKTQSTGKAQASSTPQVIVAKSVKQVERTYVPVQRRNRLFLRQIGVNRSNSCSTCTTCECANNTK